MQIELDELIEMVGRLEAEAVAKVCDPIAGRHEGVTPLEVLEGFCQARAWLVVKTVLEQFRAPK